MIENIIKIIIIIIIIYIISKFFIIEKFVNINKLESDIGNLEITDASCEQPYNPLYIGKNYSICCNKLSEGCICKFNSMNKCKLDYDTCFDNKVKSYKNERNKKLKIISNLKNDIIKLKNTLQNNKNLNLIKSIQNKIKDKETILNVLQENIEIKQVIPPGVKQQCQNIFGKCVKDNTTKLDKYKYNTDKYELVNMKQGINNNICSITLNNIDELPLCINYCNNLNNCNGGVYNKLSGICDLYNELIDVDPGMSNGDINFQAFIKKDITTKTNNHNNKKILKKNINNPLCNEVYDKNQLQYLHNTYKFNKLKLNNKIIPDINNKICNINNTSFTKCKDACLMNEKCDYLMYGNDNNLSELKNTKYELNNNNCILYNGIPNLDSEVISLSKVNDKYNYYIKKILPIDEREYN